MAVPVPAAGSSSLRAHVARELARLRGEGLLRRTMAWPQAGSTIRLADGRTLVNLSSNDYLALARDPAVVARAGEALARLGAGACASRLMCGTLELHEELERALAALCGTEAALVFSSGFGTNAGLLPALAGRDDVLFLDRLVHASLVDGARLSGATLVRFPHNDVGALGRLLERTPCRGRRVLVCESVYSMDGDVAPLAELEALARRADAALVVDEAHAVGVHGGGGGLCRALGVRPDVLVGTLGKALGSVGGFVACDPELRAYLLNRCRSFVFATALPPASAGAALAAVERLRAQPGLGEALLGRARAFRGALAARGLRLPDLGTQILPIHVGGNDEAVALAARLREEGLLVTAVRPPTVPAGTARLRLSVTLAHAPDVLEEAAERIGRAAREARVA
jgi:8-amino-7-oxononanoate synthase